MVRQRHRPPRGVSTDGDGFDARAWLAASGLLCDDAGVDTGDRANRSVRTLPAPVVLDALKAFIAGHCED